MTINILELDQVCNIASEVYFEVINQFSVYDKAVKVFADGSSENTQYGEELYMDIEGAIKRAIDYQD